MKPNWSRLTVPVVATGLGLVMAGIGTLLEPGPAGGQRFATLAFFILLYWPLGLWLAHRLAGRRWQLVVAALLLAGTASQPLIRPVVPFREGELRWTAPLAPAGQPGDAIRHMIRLPNASDHAWARAWASAAHVAVAVCFADPVLPAAGVALALNDGSPTDVSQLQRRPAWDSTLSWYLLPVTRGAVDATGELAVVVRRAGTGAGEVRVCGGQEDPTHPSAGRSARWDGRRWLATDLTGRPSPRHNGQPLAERYHVELRFYDERWEPRLGVWF